MSEPISNAAYSSTAARWASGFGQLFTLSLVRLIRSRQTLVCAALLLFASLAVTAWSIRRERDAEDFIEQIFLGLFVTFLLPIFSLAFGAAGISTEREERTLVYLLVSPLPRPLVFLAKAAASIALSAAWTLGGLTVFALIAGRAGRETWLPLAGPVLWSTIAYVSLFLLFSVSFRRATIIALGYAVFVETLIGNMPGIAKRLALSFYARCLMIDAGEPFGVSPVGPGGRDLFAGISADYAFGILLCIIVGFLSLGAITFSRREYI